MADLPNPYESPRAAAPPSAKQADALRKWSRIREGGYLRFLLLRGVLSWAMGAALYVAFMSLLIPREDILRMAQWAFVLFPAIGVLFAAGLWRWSERQWRRSMSEDEDGPW